MTRHPIDTTPLGKSGIWGKLAAPIPDAAKSWRQDGKITARDGRYFSRFVVYIEANTVRERLDSVVPGEWDLTLELLPTPTVGEIDPDKVCSFKARLQILGVIREDVGTGKDYKQAATDAFKRAAVRFGIGHELYAYEQNWVQMDGDGRYAKPLEDPQAAYTRRYGANGTKGRVQPQPGDDRPAARQVTDESGYTNTRSELNPAGPREQEQERVAADHDSDRAVQRVADRTNAKAGPDADAPGCPKCGGRMWDNRLSKRNPKAPDFKCRDRSCDGVIWPERQSPQQREAPPARPGDERPRALDDEPDDLPF